MRLENEVIETLKRVAVIGNQTTMPQLDRALYVKVNKALECLGGKWNRSAKAHVWDCDPGDPIADAVMTGEVRDWKKELQFFPTPPETARWLAELARISGGQKILEPSAGDGALVRACFNAATGADCCRIVAVEISPKLIESLMVQRQKTLYANESNFKIVAGDFLKENGELGGPFDRVVMNPPFSKGQDIAHVQHAYGMLKPKGQLAAITSPGWTFRTDAKHAAFKAWTYKVGATRYELPSGTFKASGTDIRTVALHITKT